MDEEIIVTSAAEHPEIEVTSVSEHPEIEVTSATEHPGIRLTSAAEHSGVEVASAREGPEVEVTSSAEGQEIEEGNFWFKHNFNGQAKPIFLAPQHIREEYGWYFTAHMVSIGPYYHGREILNSMEDLKLRCMSDLAKKQRNVDDVPVDPFMRFERFAHAFYEEDENFNHSPVDFVRMLVLDSCFIIRAILSVSQEVQESMGLVSDPMLDAKIKKIRSDLLLLHNQIPLFFIERVYDWFFPQMDPPEFPSFKTVLEPFISLDMPWRINHGGMSREAAHLLDLYWRSSLSSRKTNERLNDCQKHRSAPKLIPNATVLHKMAGIKFKRLNDEGEKLGGLDVIFSNGIMRMPCLRIDKSLKKLLLNLVAFESSKLSSMRTFSSYMKLMAAIIDSENDVELLQQCGVIYNTVSSHNKAADFFNDFGSFCFIDYNDHCFIDLFRDVKYYESWNHAKWASLRWDYFSSPRVGISVVAGVTLLILSALQTFYTVYGYYNPMH